VELATHLARHVHDDDGGVQYLRGLVQRAVQTAAVHYAVHHAYLQALEAEAVGQHIRDRVESALSVLCLYLYPVGHALDDLVAYLPHEDKIFWQALCSGAQPVGNVDRVVPKSGRAADLLLIIQNTVNLLVIRDLRGHNHGAVSEAFFNIQYVHRVSVPGRLCVRHKKLHMPCAANIVAQLTSSIIVRSAC
jgi:hypothetical protein